MRGLLSYIFLYIKGLCIGSTGALQGISGGSMALLLGVHRDLVFSLAAINRQAFQALRRHGFSAFWQKINGGFLLTLIFGIATGLVALHLAFNFLYRQHPILISSFFFSLVAVAALLMLRKVTRWRPAMSLFVITAVAISYLLTRAQPFTTPDHGLMGFGVGAVAGATFILPGVSGAFILMFLGKYQYILASFDSLELDVIILFIAGSMVGMTVVARCTSFLLTHYFNTTVAFLAGLMIGSLNKVWPWREVLEYVTTAQGKRIPAFDESVLPWRYLEITGKDPQLFYAVLMMASGVLMVVIFEKIAVRLKTKI